MRVGFTIILNGEHHLKHNNYAEFLAKNLDLWIIVEGAAKNAGSTSWCKDMSEEYQCVGTSVDNTVSYIDELREKYKNIILVNSVFGFWPSKDAMVNAAIKALKKHTNKCTLFEIDIDEQWTANDMLDAEMMLKESGGKIGTFLCDYYVGENLRAVGDWGEGNLVPYRRLWLWEGEYFKTHEPPMLDGENDPVVMLPQRFKHYAYYFEKDVKFKNDWYSGHEGIYERWKEIQMLPQNEFPIKLDRLITGHWGKTKTEIIYVPTDCA